MVSTDKMTTTKSTTEYSFLDVSTTTASRLCSLFGVNRCSASTGVADEVRQLTRLTFGGFDFLSTAYGQKVQIKLVNPDDVMIFYLPLNGGMEVYQKYGHVLDGAGPIAVSELDCRGAGFASQRRHIRISVTRKSLMERLQSYGHKMPLSSLKFREQPGIVNLSHVLSRLVLASFATASNNLKAPEEKLFAFGGLIENALLELWPNNFTDVINARERIVLPRQVRRAMDLIAADPFRSFAVTDIARECGVSIRTLQYGFRNFASMSIREFVVQQRCDQLARAHNDPILLARLQSQVGLSPLRKLNRFHEKTNGRPLVAWSHLRLDAQA